jgi:apoptosis-inducing factor 3
MRSAVTGLTTSSTTTTLASGVSIQHIDTHESATCEADVIILAVGVAPATEYLKDSGIELRQDGGVLVDEYLCVRYKEGLEDEAKKENVFAIGDIAVYPDVNQEGALRRIEHWNVRSFFFLASWQEREVWLVFSQVASNHGRCVGKVIAGKHFKFDKVPLFWSSRVYPKIKLPTFFVWSDVFLHLHLQLANSYATVDTAPIMMTW